MHFLQHRLLVAGAVAGGAAIAGLHTQPHPAPAPATVAAAPSHAEWVASALKAMQTIKVGMTRSQLRAVFTTEGGLATPLQQTYVFRGCPYFKVDVEFRAAGRPRHDQRGRLSLKDSPTDVITTISRPYVAWSNAD
jgi:hypothetical protein